MQARFPVRPLAQTTIAGVAAPIRIGTCSWADETLVEGLVPARRALRRGAAAPLRRALRRRRGELDLLPAARARARAALGRPHARRVHDARQGVRHHDPAPGEAGRAAAGPARRGAGRRARPRRAPEPRVPAEIFRRFPDALEPLRETGKLGGILLQFPPYVSSADRPSRTSSGRSQQLPDEELLVEFRHSSWLERGEPRRGARRSSRSDGMTYVTVDAPRTARATSSRRSSPPRPAPPTSASTAATRRPGTSAPAAPPSASTACTRPRSCASGSGRCASSPARRRSSTRCSTTTAAPSCPS